MIPVQVSEVFDRGQAVVAQAEGQSSALFREHPGALIMAVLISGARWAGMVGEYWLVLGWLGVDLSINQAICALRALYRDHLGCKWKVWKQICRAAGEK